MSQSSPSLPTTRPQSIQELLRPRTTAAHWEVAVRDVSLPGQPRSLPHVFVASGDRLLFSGEVEGIRPLTETLLSAVQTTALIRMEWPTCLHVGDVDAARHIGTCLQSVIPLTTHAPRLRSLDLLMDRLQRHVVEGGSEVPFEERPEAGASPEFVAAMLQESHPSEQAHSRSAATSDSNRSPRSP